MPGPIRNIVFDIGRVLINLHFERLLAFLLAHQARCTTINEFYLKTEMVAFEHGDITPDQFFTHMQKLFDAPPPRKNLEQAFLNLFSANDPILALTEQLKDDFRLYILSNTNVLHWQYLHEQYRLGERVHGVVTSFDARAMKPAAAIFRYAEQQHGLAPAETLFIDDLEENARGAEACGWQAIHHTTNESTLEQLRQFIHIT